MSDSGTDFDILHPEVISTKSLRSILFQRGVGSPSKLETLTRTEILEVYNSSILPLPQRELRQNRRGKLLGQSRQSNRDFESKQKRNDVRSSSEDSRATQCKERLKGEEVKTANSSCPAQSKANKHTIDFAKNNSTHNDHLAKRLKADSLKVTRLADKSSDEMPAKKRKHSLITWP